MAKRDIVILHDFLESSMELLEILRKHGYTTRFVSFRKEDKNLKKLKSPILFAQIDGDASLVQQRITDLVQMKFLLAYPIVVLGPGVDQFATILSHFFQYSVTVDSPFGETEILHAIARIDELQAISEESTGAGAKKRKFTDIFATGDLYQSLQQKDLGGKNYMFAANPDLIEDKSYLPMSEEVVNIIEGITEKADKWDVSHMHRTAYAASNMLDALGIGSERKEQAKAAAFLFQWALQDDQRLTRTEYTSANADKIKERLQMKLEESATHIIEQLDMPEAGEIVAVMASIVAGEPIDSSDELALCAATIFAADFMDRTCWQSGSWSPASAHRVLNRCKVGKVGPIPTDIMCCMLKIVLEGIEATLPKRMLPRSVSQNSALMQMAKAAQDGAIGENEKRIPLSSLQPGMKLKRPLVAFDGKTIIPQDVVLDADIIWRIWSLSAVRALNAPLVVQNDS